MAQSVDFGRTTATSGLLRRTDILRLGGHVSKVPFPDVATTRMVSALTP